MTTSTLARFKATSAFFSGSGLPPDVVKTINQSEKINLFIHCSGPDAQCEGRETKCRAEVEKAIGATTLRPGVTTYRIYRTAERPRDRRGWEQTAKTQKILRLKSFRSCQSNERYLHALRRKRNSRLRRDWVGADLRVTTEALGKSYVRTRIYQQELRGDQASSQKSLQLLEPCWWRYITIEMTVLPIPSILPINKNDATCDVNKVIDKNEKYLVARVDRTRFSPNRCRRVTRISPCSKSTVILFSTRKMSA